MERFRMPSTLKFCSHIIHLIMAENKQKKPLVRHPALQPLSRANHQGLMFCLLLDKGLRNEVSPGRMQDFIAYFFDSYWRAHRERLHSLLEDLLATSDPRAMEFRKQYQSLTDQWTEAKATKTPASVRNLKDSLRVFIRWQERKLFMELQAHHPKKIEDLVLPEAGDDICAVWPDPFWE
jgi:hypothetical protein